MEKQQQNLMVGRMEVVDEELLWRRGELPLRSPENNA
jgi:hypothetical protein